MNNTLREWVLVWVMCLFALIVGVLIGHRLTTWNIHNEATEHNAAEWRIDSKTGVTSFHWLGDD